MVIWLGSEGTATYRPSQTACAFTKHCHHLGRRFDSECWTPSKSSPLTAAGSRFGSAAQVSSLDEQLEWHFFSVYYTTWLDFPVFIRNHYRCESSRHRRPIYF